MKNATRASRQPKLRVQIRHRVVKSLHLDLRRSINDKASEENEKANSSISASIAFKNIPI
jgi:hypothetical protein